MFSASFNVETIIEIDGVGADMFLTLVEGQRPNVQSIRNGRADDGIRTRDLRFTKPLLYQLSYVGAERAKIASTGA
jgi:hypothetical protein